MSKKRFSIDEGDVVFLQAPTPNGEASVATTVPHHVAPKPARNMGNNADTSWSSLRTEGHRGTEVGVEACTTINAYTAESMESEGCLSSIAQVM